MTIQAAVNEILSGSLVVFSTETVYGLGALASNDEAVKRIFEIKGRPRHNPLILHIAANEQLDDLVQEIPETAKKLIAKFWPGPLTICFKKSEKVSDLVTANLATVCIRRPAHETTSEFLKKINEAVAAPSANLSGNPSTTTFADAKKQLEDKGVYFLDGADSVLGLESTIVDCSTEQIKLLRPGFIGVKELEAVLGEKILDESGEKKISSPGQLLAHYAPSGDLTVLLGDRKKRRQWFSDQKFDAKKKYAFGIVGKKFDLPGKLFVLSESESDLNAYAAKLYQFLNYCDQIKAEQIFLELPDTVHPLLFPLINRLEKASRDNVFKL